MSQTLQACYKNPTVSYYTVCKYFRLPNDDKKDTDYKTCFAADGNIQSPNAHGIDHAMFTNKNVY